MHVLIIDDHPMLIRGMQTLLLELEPTITSVGASNIEEGIQCAQSNMPDLILLDLNLPGMQQLDALLHMRRAVSVPIVVVSANDQPQCIQQAVDLGAAGYIPKDTDQSEMIGALKAVLEHRTYIPRHAVRTSTDDIAEATATAPQLSDRQTSVLRRLLQGKSNKSIARELRIAEGTVKAHLWAIYQALGVTSRLQAIARVYELKLVERFALAD